MHVPVITMNPHALPARISRSELLAMARDIKHSAAADQEPAPDDEPQQATGPEERPAAGTRAPYAQAALTPVNNYSVAPPLTRQTRSAGENNGTNGLHGWIGGKHRQQDFSVKTPEPGMCVYSQLRSFSCVKEKSVTDGLPCFGSGNGLSVGLSNLGGDASPFGIAVAVFFRPFTDSPGVLAPGSRCRRARPAAHGGGRRDLASGLHIPLEGIA
jgi:hypothetical protein